MPVCINQNDIKERNRQVEKMPQIYKAARQVLIWTSGVSKAVDCFSSSQAMLQFLDSVTTCESSRDDPLSDVTGFPYWNRTWIIQELFLARQAMLLLKADMLDFRIFATKYIAVAEYFFTKDSSMASDPRKRQLYILCENLSDPPKSESVSLAFRSGQAQLKGCLALARNSECSDGRDRVYGMRGLCAELTDFPVNYEADQASLLLDICGHVSPRTVLHLLSTMFNLTRALKVYLRLICPNHLKIQRDGDPSEEDAELAPGLAGEDHDAQRKTTAKILLETEMADPTHTPRAFRDKLNARSKPVAETGIGRCETCQWIPSSPYSSHRLAFIDASRVSPDCTHLTL